MNLGISHKLKVFNGVPQIFLWLPLVIVLVLGIVSIKNSYSLLREVQVENSVIVTSKSARINFDTYNLVVERIQNTGLHQSSENFGDNPFAFPPKVNK